MTNDSHEMVAWTAHQMGLKRDEFIADLVTTTRAQIRALDHDIRMGDLLHASITENVVAAVHFLERGGDEDDVGPPSAALAYARALAQRDVPLSALIRAYRIGHGRFVDEAMAVLATRSPELTLPAAMELVHRSARWIDRVCDQVGVAYEQERDRWVSSRSGLRQHWVNEVLAGAPLDIGRVEEALDYRMDCWHVAAVMWPDRAVATRDVATLFDQARSAIAAQLAAGGQSLMVPTDEREARLWWKAGGRTLDPARVITAVRDSALPVRLAVGSPAEGVEGFRRTLRMAERAKAVAIAGEAPSSPVICYRDVEPIALMALEPDGLRRFVRRVLGELAVDDERSDRLRETLREFLARNRSFSATAEALFLHRNTVQYRVTQAKDLSGCDFDDPDAVLDAQIALLACRWMGRSVLAPAGPAPKQ